MRINYGPRGILQIDDAKICYKNFAGTPSKYNRDGERNFAVIISDEEIAQSLISEGWNVKIKPPRNDEEGPFMYLPVKIKINDYGPKVYLEAGTHHAAMTPDTMGLIDKVDVLSADLDIRPYDWERDGDHGRTAYLQAARITQNVDRFAARYASEESPEE